MSVNAHENSLDLSVLAGRLGVVVIGRNEGQRLEGALRSVIHTRLPAVYVDSRSTDGSVELANRLGVKTICLDESRRVNASRARNAGFEALLREHPNLEFVHFLDGDSVVAEHWPAAAAELLDADPAIGFVCGRLAEKCRDENIFRRLCDMEWHQEASEDADCGGIGIVRVLAFRSAGGFDEGLIAGADPALYSALRNLGWKIVSSASPMGIHDSGMESFKQWWTRSVKGGYAYGQARQWGGWQRERLSALAWGFAVPAVTTLASAAAGMPGLLLLALYPLQVSRIFLGRAKLGFSRWDRLLYASSCVLIKFPQAVGIATFEYRSFVRTHGRLIEYKTK